MSDAPDDNIVKEALEAFEIALEAENENRNNAKEDIEFALLDNQWDEKIRNERQLAGRPSLTINKLKPVIRQVVNDSRQNRPATKVNPCDSNADPKTAEVLGGLIRNIEASSDADVAYDTAIEAAVAGGFGYWTINVDFSLNAVDEQSLASAGASAFEKDIFIRRVANPFSVFGDPYSQAADSSDWMQAHVIETLTRDQFKRKYRGAKETNFDDGWQDVRAPWRDGDEVQIAAYWKREKIIRKAVLVQLADTEEMVGAQLVMFEDDPELQKVLALGATVVGPPRDVSSFKVTQHVVNGVEELEKNDWAGAYIPIVPVYGEEVNIEGKRLFRSLIRSAKDSQQMFNYWQTTATEIVALAPRVPYIIEEDAIPKGEAGKWATANSQSHPYLKVKKGSPIPQRQSGPQIPAGVLEMAMQASDQIKAITGIYDASLGARSNETSGRAIMARQREGDVSTFHFIDNLTRAIRHSGRIIVDLIPKVYSTERVVRILGEDGRPDSVTLNDAQNMHDVRTGRYDVTVSAGPSFTTRREEAAMQMIELVRAFPDAAPIIGDLLARNLDWPGADEIAKRLERLLPPGAKDEEGQIDPAIQAQLQQMAEALQVLQAELQKATESRDLEVLKLKIEGYRAETDRLQAMQPAMTPEVIAGIVQQTLGQLASDGLPNAEGAPAGPGPFGQPEMGQAA